MQQRGEAGMQVLYPSKTYCTHCGSFGGCWTKPIEHHMSQFGFVMPNMANKAEHIVKLPPAIVVFCQALGFKAGVVLPPTDEQKETVPRGCAVGVDDECSKAL